MSYLSQGVAAGAKSGPPDFDREFWGQPEIVAAVAAGDLGRFILAYRGARRPLFSQDQIARWTGIPQSEISMLESGRWKWSTERKWHTLTCALNVPPSVVTRRGDTAGEVAEKQVWCPQDVMLSGQP